eukprot:s4308_g2.t1
MGISSYMPVGGFRQTLKEVLFQYKVSLIPSAETGNDECPSQTCLKPIRAAMQASQPCKEQESLTLASAQPQPEDQHGRSSSKLRPSGQRAVSRMLTDNTRRA